MSIARQLFHEFRPFFRLLEEPIARPSSFFGVQPHTNDPFINILTRPAVDISEQADKYVLDADLPGVKKENLEVKIGDNGRSITIEGRIADTKATAGTAGQETSAKSDSAAVSKTDDTATQISSERPYSRNVTFTRTVWLPRPVDSKSVSAKLDHGVLTISVKKAEDKLSTTIPIE